jgi:hypothetical protein
MVAAATAIVRMDLVFMVVLLGFRQSTIALDLMGSVRRTGPPRCDRRHEKSLSVEPPRHAARPMKMYLSSAWSPRARLAKIGRPVRRFYTEEQDA